MKTLIVIFALCIAVLLIFVTSSCAVTRTKVTVKTFSTNGVYEVRVAGSTSYTIGDATQNAGKITVRAGTGINIGETSVAQATSASNTVEALKSIDSILGKIAK